MGDDTTIRISEELADTLYDMKGRGESYEDVIRRLLANDTGDVDEPAATDNDTNNDTRGRLPCPATDTALAAVQDLEGIPGGGERLDERQCALAIAYDYLKEHGNATSGELRERGYHEATAYQSASSWWGNAGTEFLRQLPGVVSPGQGGQTWTYSGGEQ